MGKKSLVVLLTFFALWMSCKNTPSSKCGPCPEYAQLAPVLNVRIVDKTTGQDLFLSPNSPYTYSDLKVTTSLPGQDVYITVDSTQKDDRVLRIIAPTSQTFTIKLAALSANELSIVTKQDSPSCCPVLKVSKITLDNTVICSPCSFGDTVTIKK
ncbi:MAG: hypothetical protein ACHQHN_09385 [Sphingobacteriales bacterium]